MSQQTKLKMGLVGEDGKAVDIKHEAAASWARVAFLDILVFFGVLMVGFAYLWRRGDIDWVRSVTHSEVAAAVVDPLLPQSQPESELLTAQGR